MNEPTKEEMLFWIDRFRLFFSPYVNEQRVTGLSDQEADKAYDAIRSLIEYGLGDEFCICDDYKWLTEQLGGMAVFLWAHNQELKENRGPFKFCPYCSKRVKEKEGGGEI